MTTGEYVTLLEIPGGRLVALAGPGAPQDALAQATVLVGAVLPVSVRAILPVIESAEQLAAVAEAAT